MCSWYMTQCIIAYTERRTDRRVWIESRANEVRGGGGGAGGNNMEMIMASTTYL